MRTFWAERAAGAKLGTTARGIGPCYADKATRRHGLRVCDLYHADRFREQIRAAVAHKDAYFSALYDERTRLNADEIVAEYLGFAAQLEPYVCATTKRLQDLIAGGHSVLFEGAQGRAARYRPRHLPVCHQFQRQRGWRRQRRRHAAAPDRLDCRRGQGVFDARRGGPVSH